MPKISINLLRYSTPFEEIKKVLDHALAQDFEDYEVVYSENAPKGKPKLVDQVRVAFPNYPKLRIVDNGDNLGYAGGHNKFFAETNSELLMVLNPDAMLEPGYVKNIVAAFDDPRVGAAEGKMIKPHNYGQQNQGGEILDGTGIMITKTRRAYERGQLEVDHGQYDKSPDIFGVSGTVGVFRKSALESIKLFDQEYYDPDFFAYWEDLDICWRLKLQGWETKYVPEAKVYHPRAVGVSPGGLKHFITFVKHHNSFSLNIRRWNWRNHLFCIIKNDFGWNFWKAFPLIFARELVMAGFITVFSPKTWTVLPVFFRLLPKMLRKRKIIQANKKVTSAQIGRWFR